MTGFRLDRSDVDPRTLGAWSVHLGRKVDDPRLLRARLVEGTLPQAFAAAAARAGASVALSLTEGSITHAELDLASGRMARALAQLKAGPGRTVLIGADTTLSSIVAYLGTLRTGATAVLVNPTYTAREVHELGSDSEAILAIASGETLQKFTRAGLSVGELVGLDLDDRPAASVVLSGLAGDPTPILPINPDSPALFAYTSATTGRAKCVPLSHRNLLASIRGVMWAWRWSSKDLLVHTLPIAHQHGLGGIHATLLAGSRAVLLGGLESQQLLTTIEAVDATVLFGVPTIYRKLLDELGGRLEALRRLRLMTSGSAALSVDLALRISEIAGSIPLERYGSTESGLDVSNPYDGPRIPGTVGLPLPGIEVAVVDGEGRWLDRGEAGEILIRGPQVFAGYRGAASSEESPFLFDWFRTGDIGLVDFDSGHLRLVGRTKDVIVTGGMNVYPKEVEEALRAVPGVDDVAVMGVPSDRWGEEVVGFVVTRALSAGEIIEAVRRNLAPYKCPKRLVLVDQIPRNEMGKIQRNRLVELSGVAADPPLGI